MYDIEFFFLFWANVSMTLDISPTATIPLRYISSSAWRIAGRMDSGCSFPGYDLSYKLDKFGTGGMIPAYETTQDGNEH